MACSDKRKILKKILGSKGGPGERTSSGVNSPSRFSGLTSGNSINALPSTGRMLPSGAMQTSRAKKRAVVSSPIMSGQRVSPAREALSGAGHQYGAINPNIDPKKREIANKAIRRSYN